MLAPASAWPMAARGRCRCCWIVIDTHDWTPLEAAQMIITRLESEGFIR